MAALVIAEHDNTSVKGATLNDLFAPEPDTGGAYPGMDYDPEQPHHDHR